MHRSHQFGQLFEESSDPAFIVDPFSNQLLAANRAGCALLGYTRQELLITPVSHIHPADLPQLREFINRVLEHGQGSTIKLTCRTKSGTFLPIEMTLFAFGGDGHPPSWSSCTIAANTDSPGPATGHGYRCRWPPYSPGSGAGRRHQRHAHSGRRSAPPAQEVRGGDLADPSRSGVQATSLAGCAL